MKKTWRQAGEEKKRPPELLVRKRQLEQGRKGGIRGELNYIPEEWQGWREKIVGQPLIDLLDKLRSH